MGAGGEARRHHGQLIAGAAGIAASAGVPHGATRALADYTAALRYEALPDAVVEKARACVLDAVGCMLFGASLPWTRLIAAVVREEGGEPQASLVGAAGRVSVAQAALVNSAAGHGFELDDAHTRASMHAGTIATATALAISEWRGPLAGREFLTGVVAGYEAGLRVGIAAAGNLFKRGFHAGAVCGGYVAAAVAARLLGLDAGQTQHAFGIVGSMASGLMAAQEGAMVKRLHSGHAARSGVVAALLARRGFTGIPNVFEAPFGGFFSAMTDQRDLGALTAGLGAQWETLAVGFKPYATAGAIQPGLALLETIMREHALAAGHIERIEVDCTTHCRDHVAWPYVPQGVASAQMNLYYALSLMAVERTAMIDPLDEAKLADPRILGFMPRIVVTPNAEYDALGNSYRYATRLTVITKAGERLSAETRHRPGSAEAPLTMAQLEAKFDVLAARAVSAGRRERIKRTIRSLPGLETMEPLIADLRG